MWVWACASQGMRVVSVSAAGVPEVQGINDRVQLAFGRTLPATA
ncbi:MAG: hypothetical protein CM1200mP9_09940 [Gammaproteobacteria bacterium]|nr:MAG: hypothetical protein CM1200mP9_09940 [Gammaproteobacteria bacterium]